MTISIENIRLFVYDFDGVMTDNKALGKFFYNWFLSYNTAIVLFEWTVAGK